MNFGPLGILWLQLSDMVCSFCWLIFGLEGTLELQLSGIVCICFLNSGFRGFWGSSCWVLPVLFYVAFGPWGTLGLQLSGIVCSSRLSILGSGTLGRQLWGVVFPLFILGLGELWVPAFMYWQFFFFVNSGPQGTLGLQLSDIVVSCSLLI